MNNVCQLSRMKLDNIDKNKVFFKYNVHLILFIILIFSISLNQFQYYKIKNLNNKIIQTNLINKDLNLKLQKYPFKNLYEKSRILNLNLGNYFLKINSTEFEIFEYKKRTKNPLDYIHSNQTYIKNLNKQILNYSKKINSTYIQELIYFIHSIKYSKDSEIGYDEYFKFPIETLVEKTGDCEDTTFLMISLLKEQNYDVMLFQFENHFALGVRCDELSIDSKFSFKNTGYCFLESTGNHLWSGEEIPKNLTKLIKIYKI